MKKSPLKKKPKIKTLKNKLDKLFSEFIRRRGADKEGMTSCFTCGKVDHWKSLQCGHFVSRGYLSTRFDERNCRVQCVGCNIFGGGKTAIFGMRLEKERPGIVLELFRESSKIIRYFPYEEKIAYYTAQNKAI